MGIATGTAILIGAGVAAAGAVGSAAIQSKASKKAARTYAQAEQTAIDKQLGWEREVMEQTQEALDNFSYTQDPTNEFASLENHYNNLGNAYEQQGTFFQDLENRYGDLSDPYAGLDNRYAGLDNAYDDLQDPYADLSNPFSEVSNPFAGAQVAREAVDFQQESELQQFANILDSVQQSGGVTASSATALAREAGASTRRLAGKIEEQERQNTQQFAQVEFNRQLAVAQGDQTLGLARAGASQQRGLARAGAQNQLNILGAQGQSAIDFASAGQQSMK